MPSTPLSIVACPSTLSTVTLPLPEKKKTQLHIVENYETVPLSETGAVSQEHSSDIGCGAGKTLMMNFLVTPFVQTNIIFHPLITLPGCGSYCSR